MSQEDKLTIKDYFQGRLQAGTVDEIRSVYKDKFKKSARKVYISQVFHFHTNSTKVWECIREVAIKRKMASIEFRQYMNA